MQESMMIGPDVWGIVRDELLVLSVWAKGVLQTWIQGINAGTVCTTRAHGSARATMYSQSDAHSIERGTTYSTCVHSTKLDTAYTQPGRSWYEPQYQLRNSHTGYRLRYRLHTIRPELVLSTIPRAQHVHMVPVLVPPTFVHTVAIHTR